MTSGSGEGVDNDTRTSAGGTEGESSAATKSFCPSNLRILICTGNLGNAAPTKDSFAAWLPKNGSVDEVLTSAKYPHPEGYDPPTESDMGGVFDIIVVGMQEAVFNAKEKKNGKNGTKNSLGTIDEKIKTGAGDGAGTSTAGTSSTSTGSHGKISLSNLARVGLGPDGGKISIANLKMASIRGMLPRRGSASSMISDDSMMSLVEKDEVPDIYGYSGGGEEEGVDLATMSSRDGPMPGKSLPKDLSSRLTPTKVVRKAGDLVVGTADGIVNVTKEKLIAPVATGIVSAAGSADHTRGEYDTKKTRSKILGVSTTALQGANPGEWVGGTKELYELGDAHIGSGYVARVRFQRGEMRLAILVRNELAPLITKVETLAENTGIGGVIANKGGIISTLTIGGTTRLSFLTAHLEAHEGKEHYKNRCSNLADILSGAKKGSLDTSVTSHHMFVMGDLNFRVALPPPGGREKWDGAIHRQKVRDMVEDEKWAALHAADELRGALEKGDCLAGFQTLPCHFHPTFKVHRELGFRYQEKRTPSYTDRILWKSAHGLKNDVRPLLYEPVSDYATSDHKPVRGAYAISMKGQEILQGKPGDRRSQLAPAGKRIPSNLHIFISDIYCQDLSRAWEGRQNAPYILFVTDPEELARAERSTGQKIADKFGLGGYTERFAPSASTRVRDGFIRTRVNKEDGENPDWGDAEVHLKIKHVGIDGPEDLAGANLYLNVYDLQGFSANEDDYLIGTVALNLQELAKNSDDGDDHDISGTNRGRNLFKSIMGTGNSAPIFDMIEIDEALVKNGKEKGRLCCTIMAWWLNPNLEGNSLSKRRSVRHIKGAKKKKGWWPFGGKKKR